MALRSVAAVAALAFASSIVACSIQTDDASSQEQAHTEDQPTIAQYKWLWADETLDEFRANAEATAGWGGAPEFLPVDHPMAQRLQFWVDQIDRALRARAPEALRATPKPQIILRKDSDPNAWVTFLPVAWDVPTRLERADASPASPSDSDAAAPADDAGAADAGAADAAARAPEDPAEQFFLATTGKITTLSYGEALERPHDAAMVKELAEFYDHGFSKCRVTAADDALVFGKDCVIDPQVRKSSARSIAFYTTSKWVTVTTGLITEMLDEPRIIAVLAHELGHYYRTHASIPSDLLNYFYDLGEANVARKPAPDSRFLEQTQEAREKLRAASWFTDFSKENDLMVDQRLGFYTTEQEADEISLEALARIGLPPTLGPDSMLQLQKVVEDMSSGYGGESKEIGWEKCSTMRERGFRDDEGKEISVPIGNLTDPHHSFCFRVFNMARELSAHRYVVADERPQPPGESWTRLVTRLSAEIDPPPPPPEDAGAPDADAGAPDGGAESDAGAPPPQL